MNSTLRKLEKIYQDLYDNKISSKKAEFLTSLIETISITDDVDLKEIYNDLFDDVITLEVAKGLLNIKFAQDRIVNRDKIK